MQRLILRWAINAVAVWAAVALLPGVDAAGVVDILVVALIFGLANALIRPILKLLTCPLIILTLGLFTLVLNALMFWLAGWLGANLGFGFWVDGFLSAFLGGLIVSAVSVVLTLILKDELKRR